MTFVPNLNFLRLFDSQIGLRQPKDLGCPCHLQRILDQKKPRLVEELRLGRRFVCIMFS